VVLRGIEVAERRFSAIADIFDVQEPSS
jgi:hypothetical protein